MSSSVHSPSSTSSDVVLTPHPLNYVNHNHTDTPSTAKTLKRSRSPSLTRDDNNETNDSTTNPTTPTKKSRKKRNTTDVDQSLGFVYSNIPINNNFILLFNRLHISADKLYIYQWPQDELHADFHILQEQICDYLSLKSFKRKYPGLYTKNSSFRYEFFLCFIDISRRVVDLHEREYLKSQNVVTEAQCDLGLTALKLDEVLQLMSTDYPEKYHVRIFNRNTMNYILFNTFSNSIMFGNKNDVHFYLQIIQNRIQIQHFYQHLFRINCHHHLRPLLNQRIQLKMEKKFVHWYVETIFFFTRLFNVFYPLENF